MVIRFLETEKPKVKFIEKPVSEIKPKSDVLPPEVEKFLSEIEPEKKKKIEGILKERAVMKIPTQAALGFVKEATLGLGEEIGKRLPEPVVAPEPETTPERIAEAGGRVAGFFAGPSKLIKAGKEVIRAGRTIPKLIKPLVGGAEAAGGYALSDIPRTMQKPEEVGKESVVAGALGTTLPIVGAGIKGAAKLTERIVGGITKSTQEWIAKRGARVVFEPAKSEIDYLSKNVVPKVQERIATAIERNIPGTPNMLTKLGVSPEDANIIRTLAPEKRKFVSDIIRGKVNNVEKQIDNINKSAGRLYGNILRKVKPETQIDIKDTYFKLKRNLTDMGLFDLAGKIKVPEQAATPTAQAKLANIYRELDDYMKYGNGKINISDYQKILNDYLESALSQNPRWDRIVYQAQDSLRNSATKSIPELATANKMYRDAKQLEQISNALGKMGEEGRQPINLLLETKIRSLKDVGKYQTQQLWRNIMGNDLYNNTLDHLANIDYGLTSQLPGAGGGIYPSRSGFLRAGVTAAGKQTRLVGEKLPKPETLKPVIPLSVLLQQRFGK